MNTLKSLITTGKNAKPPRILLYAPEGIGKSSFGADALNPIFIPTEDGLDELDVAKFPKATTFKDVMDYLLYLFTEKHDYKTLVIDTVDWLETLVWANTCAIHGKANIEDFGFGKGYNFAMDAWNDLMDKLDKLRDKKGMAILLIGHAEIRRFDSPDVEPFDRYQVKIHKTAAAKLTEWCDAVLFANYQIFTEKTDVGFNKKVIRGKGGHSRLMYTEERPAFKCKNRYGLPPEMPFVKGEAWNTLVTAIKASRTNTEEKGE